MTGHNQRQRYPPPPSQPNEHNFTEQTTSAL